MIGHGELVAPSPRRRQYSFGMSSTGSMSSFPSQPTQTNPRMPLKGNTSEDTILLDEQKDTVSLGSNQNSLISSRTQEMMELRKRTMNMINGASKPERKISDQASLMSTSTKGSHLFRESTYSGLKNSIAKEDDLATISISSGFEHYRKNKDDETRTEELSTANHSTHFSDRFSSNLSTYDGESDRLFVESRDASRSSQSELERMLSSSFKGNVGSSESTVAESDPIHSLRNDREQPPNIDTASVRLFSSSAYHEPLKDNQSIRSINERQEDSQRSFQSLSSVSGEGRSHLNSYTTPRKSGFSHVQDENDDDDNDDDTVSSKIIDRHEKVKAIMERVTKLKSSSSKHSIADGTDTIDSFSYGGNSFNGFQGNQESSIKGIINFRKENNQSPISLATTTTNRTVSTFRAEMMKFKEKWRIQDDDENKGTEGDSLSISTSSQKMSKSLYSNASSPPLEIDKVESTSVPEEDFKLTMFQQDANEQSEDLKKDLFDIRKENLALKAQIQSLERKNEFLSQEHVSEMQLKNNEITKLQTNIASISEKFCMEESGSNYDERQQILEMKSIIENLENELKEKELYEMSTNSRYSNTPRSISGRNPHESSNEELRQAKSKNANLIGEIDFLRKALNKAKSLNGNKTSYEAPSSERSISDTNERIETLEDEKNKINKQLLQATTKASELEKVISKKDKEITMLKSEMSHSKDVDDMKKKSQMEMNRLRQEGREARYEKEVQTLRNELEESKVTVNNLHEKLSTVEENLAEAESKLLNMNGLKAMIKESESFVAHLQNDKELLMERHDAALESINKELAEKERSSYQVENELSKKIKALERQKDMLVDEMEMLSKESNEKIVRLETSLSTEENNVASLRSRSSELNTVIEEKSRVIIQLEHDIEDLKTEISSLNREKTTTDLEMKSLKKSFEREKEKLSKKVEFKLRESQEAIDSLRKASQRKDKFVESLQHEISRLSKSSKGGEVSPPYQSRKEHKSLIDFIEKELSDVRQQKAEVEINLDKARNNLVEMKKHVETSAKSFLDKMVCLENESNEKDNIIVSLQNEINELNNCIEGKILLTKRELEQMEAELTNARRIIEQDEDVQHILSNHQELQKSNTALKELVNVLREKMQNMEEKLKDQYKELRGLRGESDNSKNKFSDEVQRLEIEVAEANKKKESAEAKLKENAKLLARAESIMAKTNEATLSAVMGALNKKK